MSPRLSLTYFESNSCKGEWHQYIVINEAVRARELRVIGTSGEQLGIMSRQEALRVAEEAGVDLVNIARQPTRQ